MLNAKSLCEDTFSQSSDITLNLKNQVCHVDGQPIECTVYDIQVVDNDIYKGYILEEGKQLHCVYMRRLHMWYVMSEIFIKNLNLNKEGYYVTT